MLPLHVSAPPRVNPYYASVSVPDELRRDLCATLGDNERSELNGRYLVVGYVSGRQFIVYDTWHCTHR